MIRKSTAEWQGDGLHGSGSLSTQSGALRAQPYSFKTRILSEDGKAGTNPEELLGAAHAGCLAMSIAFALAEAGYAPRSIRATADVAFSKIGEGFAITSIALDVEARVDGIGTEQFRALAEAAKKNCMISKALAATPISLTARLG
jgi:osmotically inducible protein OsmC